ncbi:MAG: hypothetical protein ACKV2U_20345 [Bryobacteraceae bacterium]
MKRPRTTQVTPGKPFSWTPHSGFLPWTDLFDCGVAYRAAANAVFAMLLQEGNRGSLEAHPLVFLYRHSVEACVKAILYDFGVPLGITNKNVRDRGHDLSNQLPDLMRVSQTAGKRISERTKDAINQLNSTDPSGTNFRYAGIASRKGTFNLRHFHEEMELALEEIGALHSELVSEVIQDVAD